ncbi:MAG: hypothetical protein IPL31_16155 [Saprospiraceae bacterium]|nr:hypothetical protein [Saprospiraceae bacterium]
MEIASYFLILIIIVLIILVFYQQSKISEKARKISNLELVKNAQKDSIEKSEKTVSVLGYESINDKIFEIPEPAAKKMVQAYVNELDKCRNPGSPKPNDIERSVYFPNKNIREYLGDHITNSQTVGLKIYFGKYDYNDTDIVKYVSSKLTNPNDYNKFKEFSENRFSVILALTNEKGEIDLGKTLLNLGGLCPPDCRPARYSTDDPLYHD